jgi:hypothetical protein
MHLGMSYVYASVMSGALDANKRPGDEEIREDERRSIWMNSVFSIATRSLNDVVYGIAILS